MIHIFIINHYAGSGEKTREIRKHLSTIIGLRYFVFNTQKPGYETEIVKKMTRYFEDEKLRFYCCGGSGTMRNMLNGIEDFSKIELAFYPCGMTNDYLKSFKNDEEFENLDNLIFGKTVKVDYIKTNYGRALNTLSLGFDSNVVKFMNAYKVYELFGKQVPYFLSVVTGVILNKTERLIITSNGTSFTNKFVEVVVGNGCVLGGNIYYTEKNSINDGKLSYLGVVNQNLIQSLFKLVKLMQKKLPKLKDKNIRTGSFEKISIRQSEGRSLYVNFDGELVKCNKEIEIEIVEKGLNFVIPRAAEIKEFTLE